MPLENQSRTFSYRKPEPEQPPVKPISYEEAFGTAPASGVVSYEDAFGINTEAVKPISYEDAFGVPKSVPERGLLGDIGSHLARGGVKTVEMAGRGLQVADLDYGDDAGIVDKVGKKMQTWAEKADYDILQPDASEVAGEESWVKQKAMEGVQSIPMSLAPFAAAAAAGGVAAATVGGAPVAATVFGLGALATIFGGGTYSDKREELETQHGMSSDVAHTAGLKHGLIEMGSELISDIALALITLGTGGNVAAGAGAKELAKQSVRALISKSPKEIAKDFGKIFLAEWGSETGAAYLQSAVDHDLGIAEQISLVEAAVETAIPTAVVTLTFGLGSVAYSTKQRKNLRDTLASEESTPEARENAANVVWFQLNKEDPVLAEQWRVAAQGAIDAGAPISIDASFESLVPKKTQAATTQTTDTQTAASTQTIDTTPAAGTIAKVAGEEPPIPSEAGEIIAEQELQDFHQQGDQPVQPGQTTAVIGEQGNEEYLGQIHQENNEDPSTGRGQQGSEGRDTVRFETGLQPSSLQPGRDQDIPGDGTSNVSSAPGQEAGQDPAVPAGRQVRILSGDPTSDAVQEIDPTNERAIAERAGVLEGGATESSIAPQNVAGKQPWEKAFPEFQEAGQLEQNARQEKTHAANVAAYERVKSGDQGAIDAIWEQMSASKGATSAWYDKSKPDYPFRVGRGSKQTGFRTKEAAAREEAKRRANRKPGFRIFDQDRAIHKSAVQKAIKEGKQVPPEVLADYPELNNTPSASAPASASQGVASQPASPGPDQAASGTPLGAPGRVDDFSGSKVKRGSKRLLTLYRGISESVEDRHESSALGVFATADKGVAQSYAGEKGVLKEVEVNITNPFEMTSGDIRALTAKGAADLKAQLIKQGHDGIFVKPDPGAGGMPTAVSEYIAFNEQQVREKAPPPPSSPTGVAPATAPVEGGLQAPPDKETATLPGREVVAKLGSEFGLRGLNAKRYTVDGNFMGNTPEEAVTNYQNAQGAAAEQTERKANWEQVSPKIKDGTYTAKDIKAITQSGKETASTNEMVGILRELGLKKVQAGKIVQGVPHVHETAGGTVYRDVARVIEAARSNGLLPGREVGEGGTEKAPTKEGLDSDKFEADTKTEDFAPRYSVRSWTPAERNEVLDTAKRFGISKKKALKWIRDVDNVMAIILNDPSLDFDATAVGLYSALKANSDPHYSKSLDFSTLCRKRYVLMATIEQIQLEMGRAVTKENWAEIKMMLAKKGFPVSCGACYVDSKRMEQGKFINQFLDSHPDVKPESVLTQAGIDSMKRDNPELYKEFKKKVGSNNSKTTESRVDYFGEIRTFFGDPKHGEKRVLAFNKRSGLRWQSWSDFEVPHLMDAMQAIVDMSLVKLKGHAYTKVPDFIEAMGKTGLMINASLIPKGNGFNADGTLAFDKTEGMPFEKALELRAKYPKTVGTIAIGISNDHIEALLADPRIDYVIPYHASGLSRKFQKIYGMGSWADFTKTQTPSIGDVQKFHDTVGKDFPLLAPFVQDGKVVDEKGYIKKAKDKGYIEPDFDEYWKDTRSGKANGDAYLKMMADRGALPKFRGHKFKAREIRDFTGHPGYWKMLVDRKSYTEDGKPIVQKPVVPEYDQAAIERIYQNYEPAPDQADPGVVQQFLKMYQGPVKLSTSPTTQTDTNSPAFRRWFAGSKVVDADGAPLVVYHGTPFGNFLERAKSINKLRGENKAARTSNDIDYKDARNLRDQINEELNSWEENSFAEAPLHQRGKLRQMHNDLRERLRGDLRFARDLVAEFAKKDAELSKNFVMSQKEVDAFTRTGDNDSGYLGRGFYFTADKALAESYAKFASRSPLPGETRSPYIYEAFLSLQNPFYEATTKYTPEMAKRENELYELYSPLRPDVDGYLSARSSAKSDMLKEFGYDGIIGVSGAKEGVEYVAFNPTQIKSIHNQGTWDGTDPDIQKSTSPLPPANQATRADLTREQQRILAALESKGTLELTTNDEALRILDRYGKDAAFSKTLNLGVKDSDIIPVGDTPAVLIALGAKPHKLVITGRVINKITQGKHKGSLDVSGLMQVQAGLYNPVAVFKSATEPNTLVVLTEVVDRNGKMIIVPVLINGRLNRNDVNIIKSMYGKDDINLWVKGQLDNLVYVNNKKAETLRRDGWLHLPAHSSRGIVAPVRGRSASSLGGNIILTEEDVVNQDPDVKYSKDGRVQGMTMPDGKVYVVPENIRKGSLWGVVKHEVSGHLRKLLQTEKAFQAILDSIESRKEEQSPTGDAIRRAAAMIPKDTPAANVREENLAYLLEIAPEIGIASRFIALIKRLLVKMGFSRDMFTVEDYAAMADAALRSEAYDGQIGNEAQDARTEAGATLPGQLRDSVAADVQGRQGDTGRDASTNPATTERAAGVNTAAAKAFTKWFAKSKVTENGQPKVVYHGSPTFGKANNFTFDPDRATGKTRTPGRGLGTFFAADRTESVGYAGTEGEIQGVFLRVENPLVINSHELPDFASVEAAKAYRRVQQKAGHDGIHIKDEDHWVIFDAGQAKSADKNSGAYSRGDNDIRFSQAPSPHNWDAPLDSRKDTFLYNAQNKFIDLFRVQEAIKRIGGIITEKTDVRLAEELYHKRAATRVRDFLTGEVRPLMQRLSSIDKDGKEFERFLWARHAEEANESLRKRNPTAPELQAMKNAAEAERDRLISRQIVKDYLAKERELAVAKNDTELGNVDDSLESVVSAELEQLKQDPTVQAFIKAREVFNGLKKVKPFTGDNTWLSGMKNQESQDFMDALPADKRQEYNDLAREWDGLIRRTRQTLVDYGLESQETVDAWANAYQYYVPLHREDMDGGKGIGQGFSVKGSATRGRTGSYKAVADILANVVMQRERSIVRGEKAQIARALHGLATENPNPEFWSTEIPPKERTVDQVTGMVVERADMGFKSRKNVVVARFLNAEGQIEEKAVVFEENNPRALRMAEALKNLDTDQVGAILGASAVVTRWFSAINTQYNIIFGVVNLTRDAQAGALNLSTTPLAGKQKAVLKAIPKLIPELYKAVRAETAGTPRQTTIAKAWREMQLEGGTTGFRDMFETSEDRANRLRKDITEIASGRPLKTLRNLKQWVSDYNDVLENSTRLAVYMEAKNQGMSKKRAAQLAKDITLNFNRKGKVASQAGAMYAFFNAAAQGTEKVYRTMAGPAGKKILSGGLILGAAQTLLLAAAGFDDDEPPEFIRERNIIIPIGGKKYVTIPMPLGFHAIPNLSRVPMEWAISGFKDPGARVVQLAAVFAEAFNPLGNAGFSIQTIAPTPIDPLVALAENRDWTGMPIAKPDFNSLKPTPGHTRARNAASWLSTITAKGLNYLTGGNEYVPGMLSPTPDQIDYLAGQILGGVGRETGKLLTTATGVATGEAVPSYKIPLVGRFYGDATGNAAISSRFYANVKRINRHDLQIDGLRESGGDLQGYLQKNPEARMITMTGRTYREVQKLQRYKRLLLREGAGREKIVEVEERIAGLMQQVNSRIEKLEG